LIRIIKTLYVQFCERKMWDLLNDYTTV